MMSDQATHPNPDSKENGNLGSDILPFLILLLAWFPVAVAKYDKYRNGPSEDMGLEMLLAILWLVAFWLLGIVLSIRAVNAAIKKSKSPALPFFAILLHIGSVFSPFLWWLFFD